MKKNLTKLLISSLLFLTLFTGCKSGQPEKQNPTNLGNKTSTSQENLGENNTGVPGTTQPTGINEKPEITNATSSVTGLDGESVVSVNSSDAIKEVKQKYNINILNSPNTSVVGSKISAGIATNEHGKRVLSVLESLPESFRKCTSNIYITKKIQGDANGFSVEDQIYVIEENSAFERTLIHEMGHEWQYKNSNLGEDWIRRFWNGNQPKSDSVTEYGNTRPAEDISESVAEYVTNGKQMKTTHPDRYAFVKDYIMGGKEF